MFKIIIRFLGLKITVTANDIAKALISRGVPQEKTAEVVALLNTVYTSYMQGK